MLHLEALEDRRMMAIGDLDPAFGDSGIFSQDYPLSVWQSSIATTAVQSDGKIVAVGSAFPTSTAIARFNPDGSLDPTFGANGRVLVDRITDGDHSRSVVIHGDWIYAASSVDGTDGGSDMRVSRFSLAGVLDPTFGEGGHAVIDFGSDNAGPSLLLMNGEKIVAVGGVSRTATATDFAVAQLDADGSIDTSFGYGGKVTTDFRDRRPNSIDNAFDDLVNAAVIQGGTLLVAGTSVEDWRPCGPPQCNDYGTGGAGGGGGGPQPVHTEDLVFARYSLLDGSLDSQFGINGKAEVVQADAMTLVSAAALDDGGVLLGGQIEGSFALLRLTAAGQLEPSFGVNGRVPGVPTSGGSGIRSLLVQGDRAIAIGSQWETSYLAGYHLADGSLDTTFGNAGTLVNTGAEFYIGTAWHGDGFLVYGQVGDFPEANAYSDPKQFAIRGYTAMGQPDQAYNGGRVVATDFYNGVGADVTFDTARLGDGRLLLLAQNADGQTLVLRLQANGTVDESFGNGGSVSINPNRIQPTVMALQGEKILLFEKNSAVVRLNADGTIDTSFGNEGLSYLPGVFTESNQQSCGYSYVICGTITNARADSLLVSDSAIILTGTWTSDVWSYSFLDDTYEQQEANSGMSVVRLSPDGQFLTRTIRNLTPTNGDMERFDDAALHDGQLVLSAEVNGRVHVARLNEDASFDPTFGIGGVIATDISGWMRVVPADGAVLLAGKVVDGDDSKLGIAKYLDSGSVDASFGVNGHNTVDLGFELTDANAVRDADGRLVVSASDGSTSVLMRFAANGAVDASFGSAGVVQLQLRQNPYANNLQLDSQQNIYVSGAIFDEASDLNIAVVKVVGALLPVTVNVIGGTFTYDGLPHPGAATVTGSAGFSGLAQLNYYAGATLLSGPPVAAGTYTVVATYSADGTHSGGSATAVITVLPKDLSATASTENTINIAKAGTITFNLSSISGLLAGDGSIYSQFQGANFHLRVGQNDYSVSSTATVLNDGSVQVAWRMSKELYDDLFALLGNATPSSKTLIDFFVSGTSQNGNYTLTEDVFSRIFQQGKVVFS